MKKPFLFFVLISVLFFSCVSWNNQLETKVESVIQKEMQKIINYVNGWCLRLKVNFNEFIVLAFNLAQKRDPSILEYYMLKGLNENKGYHLSYENLLAIALIGDDYLLTYDDCLRFIQNVRPGNFSITKKIKQTVKELEAVDIEKIIEEKITQALEQLPFLDEQPVIDLVYEKDKSYQTYFGYLHAHSDLSDGEGTPEQAYAYARDKGKLDFFALTDHAFYFHFWPWDNKWNRLKNAAKAADDPGSFAALWGFEWTSPVFGHINVLNSEKYQSCISRFWIWDFYIWLSQQQNVFARFNHPGDVNWLNVEFLHLYNFPLVTSVISGIETWVYKSGFEKYYYTDDWGKGSPYIDVGNLNNWYLGALGGQDNHAKTWGTLNDYRVGVLADGLTRENIFEAYQHRRYYATEDKDLFVDFRCQGYPMGSRIYTDNRDFTVKVKDQSNDNVKEVVLLKNGKEIDKKQVSGPDIEVNFSDAVSTGKDYYYVIVRMQDDGNDHNNEAITTPIWILGPNL